MRRDTIGHTKASNKRWVIEWLCQVPLFLTETTVALTSHTSSTLTHTSSTLTHDNNFLLWEQFLEVGYYQHREKLFLVKMKEKKLLKIQPLPKVLRVQAIRSKQHPLNSFFFSLTCFIMINNHNFLKSGTKFINTLWTRFFIMIMSWLQCK